jgi:hypothetical protein
MSARRSGSSRGNRQRRREINVSTDVPFDNIPDSVLDEVRLGLQHYFVPLLVLSPENPRQPVDLAGSGTLVELVGRHYILTADHVWHKTDGWSDIGLVVVPEGPPLAIPRDRIVPKRLRASSYSRWGPDLALLEIPPHLVSAISARKSFLNLARQRSLLPSHPPKIDKTLWAVTGLVGESSEVEALPVTQVAVAKIRGEAFFGVTCTADRRKAYDYLTVNAKTSLPGVPSSFKGVSGAGLWQITLKMKVGTVVWRGERHFRGVAFWEEPQPTAEHVLAIRCHGPRSIFQKAWSEWGLSSVRKLVSRSQGPGAPTSRNAVRRAGRGGA